MAGLRRKAGFWPELKPNFGIAKISHHVFSDTVYIHNSDKKEIPFSVCLLTTLENMEISGNLLILENSGNLTNTLVCQMLFFVTQSETHNEPTCKLPRLQLCLCHHAL